MKKPSWFRWIDLLTMTPGALMSFGALIYSLIVGVDSPHATQGMIGLAVVGLCFLGIWGRFVWARKQWLDTFVWYPTYGIMLQPENWQVPAASDVDELVRKVIVAWTPYFPNAEQLIKAETNWVWFRKGLDESAMNPAHKKVNGLTIYGSHEIEVDYDQSNDPIAKTALRHEFGHVIMGNATGQWDNDTHHAFMQEHGLL